MMRAAPSKVLVLLAPIALLPIGGALASHAANVAERHAEAGYVEDRVNLPLFGKVKVYRPEPIERARGVVLFVSGDGGWRLGVVDMARRSAAKAIVVGLSMAAWQKKAEKDPAHCWFPAGELESTAQAIEKIYRLPRYIRPILVGYSSGATAVYGALAQAPAEAFAGGVSLGFCPDLQVARPVCSHEEWRPSYDPKKKMSQLPARSDLPPRPDGAARWIALQGEVDKVCEPRAVGAFTSQIPAARLVSLPKVGHGFSAPRNWAAAYDAALDGLLEPVSAWQQPGGDERRTEGPVPNHSPEVIRGRLNALDLPLEVQWLDGASTALIFVSGDGGWAELDQRIAAALAAHGVGVVGWNTLQYFWQPRTPDEFRVDLTKVIDALPEGIRIFAGGFSFGAEVVPVSVGAARREPDGGLSRIEGLVLLGPGPYATFEVSPLDWILTGESPTDHPVAEALGRLAGIPVLCIDAAQHAQTGCPSSQIPGLVRVTMPGGHHFGGDYEGLASRVLDFMKER